MVGVGGSNPLATTKFLLSLFETDLEFVNQSTALCIGRQKQAIHGIDRH